MAELMSISTGQVKGTDQWITVVQFMTEFIPDLAKLETIVKREI